MGLRGFNPIATGEEIAVLKHDSRINDIEFSPDGKNAATASNDHTGRLWACSTEEMINKSRNCLTRNLTQEDREQYDME